MPITTHDIRQSLLAQDPEFRNLVEQHSRCESLLEELLGSQYVSAENLIEEAELKKMKLRLKDQMEMIVARHQHNGSH